MKRVEILHYTFDTLVEDYHNPNRIPDTMKEWLAETEEGKFIEQHTKKPVQFVCWHNPLDFRSMIMMYAYFDEEIETFWRLKFK
jgi:hypothetical protein